MADIPTARDFISKGIIVFRTDENIFDAIDRLVSKGYATAPVVDEEDHIVGILTDKDCLRTISSSIYETGELKSGPVSDFMSPVKATVESNMDLFAVAHQFLQTNFVCLPVVEEDGRVLGQISRRDVLRGIQIWNNLDHKKRVKFMKNIQKGARRPSSIEDMQRMIGSYKKEQIAEVFRREEE